MPPIGLIAKDLVPPFLVAFVLSAVVFPGFIKFLKRKQFQQYLREDGPQSHAHKKNTPTAGGACFILVFLVTVVGWHWVEHYFSNFDAVPVVATALACGAIVFLDDFAKIRQKANEGLSARLRLLSEFALGAVLGAVLCWYFPDSTRIYLSNLPNYSYFDAWFPLFVLLSSFLVAATTNAFNLHDGMDGLAAGTSFMVLLTLTIMLVTLHMPALAGVAATACGAIGGFLIYNKNPAKVFMGDTGSLFIGGLLASLVLASGTLLYFIPLSLIYVAEAASSLLQMSFFKLTKPYTPEKPMSKPALALYKLTHRLPGDGKRIFRMAPLHHHFEAVLAEHGVKESQVVVRFWLVQLGLCSAVLILFFALRQS